MNTYLKNFAVSLIALGVMASGTAVAQNDDGGRDWRQGPPSVEDVLARMEGVPPTKIKVHSSLSSNEQ